MLSSQNPSSSSDPADLPGRVVCLHVERNLSPADIAAHLALPLAHILAILESPSARELADTIRRIHAQFAPLRAAQARLDALHRTYRIATTDPSDARRLRACIALIEGRTLPEPQPRQRGAGGPPASNRGEVGRHSPSVAASAPRVDDCDALMSDPAAIAPSAPLSASTDRTPLPANPLAVSHDPIAHTSPRRNALPGRNAAEVCCRWPSDALGARPPEPSPKIQSAPAGAEVVFVAPTPSAARLTRASTLSTLCTTPAAPHAPELPAPPARATIPPQADSSASLAPKPSPQRGSRARAHTPPLVSHPYPVSAGFPFSRLEPPTSGSTPRPHAFALHTCVSLRARDAPPPILSRAA